MADSSDLPIRVGMDVYANDSTHYIGTVVAIFGGGAPAAGGPGKSANPTGSEASPPSAPIRHEEGAEVGSAENRGPHVLGEELGPVPTIASGNTGPEHQSAAQGYATASAHPESSVRALIVRPGRMNLGPLTRPLHIPVSTIRSLSMERIVLSVSPGIIPRIWWWKSS